MASQNMSKLDVVRTEGFHIFSLWSISPKQTRAQSNIQIKVKRRDGKSSFTCWVVAVVLQVCGRKIHLSRVLKKFDLLLFLSLEERLGDLERPCAPPRCLT